MSEKIPFLQKKLSRAYMHGFAKDIGDRSEQMRTTVMDPRNVLAFHHGKKWDSPANEVGDTSAQLTHHSSETELHLRDVVAGDANITFRAVKQVSEQMHSSMMGMMIAKLNETTNKTGNVVDAVNRPFPEAFAEMLEMLQPSLDENGELQMPTMLVAPSQGHKFVAALEDAGPDFKRHIENVKVRKKREAEENEIIRIDRFERRPD